MKLKSSIYAESFVHFISSESLLNSRFYFYFYIPWWSSIFSYINYPYRDMIKWRKKYQTFVDTPSSMTYALNLLLPWKSKTEATIAKESWLVVARDLTLGRLGQIWPEIVVYWPDWLDLGHMICIIDIS